MTQKLAVVPKKKNDGTRMIRVFYSSFATSQNSVPPGGTPVDLHSAMRKFYESRRRKMEAEVLSEFAVNLMEVAKNRRGM